jgi:hypothetical protein
MSRRVAVVLVLDPAGSVGRGTQLITEAGRPHGKRSHRVALGQDRGFHVNYITLIKTESLADHDILIGVFESD